MNLSRLHSVKVDGWKLTTVGVAAEICNNLRFPINEEVRGQMAGEYAYYGPTGLLAHINEYRVEGTFALIGEDGDHFLKFRDKAMTLLVRGRFNVNNHAHLLRGTAESITEWLFYFYMHADLSSHLTRQGVGRFKLTKEALSKLPLLLPPLPEQRKIADILTTWDEALEKLDALIAAKELRKKALMQQLLTGKKRLKAFSTKPWASECFGNLLRQEDRYVEFNDEQAYRLVSIRRRSGGVFFREVLNGNDIKTKVMKQVHYGDFLISRMQVVHGALGMVREDCDCFYASDSYEVLVAKDSTKLHMPFLDWMSRQRSFWHLTYVCSHGVHIEKMTFNLENFMRKRIVLPGDYEEQRQIAAILDTCDSELRILRTERIALDQQKRGLMQRLLTGRIRVRLEKT